MAAKSRKSSRRKKTTKVANNTPAPKALRTKQTKTQILQALAEDTGLSRVQIKLVLDSLSTLAKRHIMKRGSGEFNIPELGVKLRRVQRKARMARNPMTGEAVRVPAKTAIKASILKSLKDAAA